MDKLIPKMYQKSIYDINYDKLKKEKNIKVLLFDLDNTLLERKNYDISPKLKKLFEKLNKEFIVFIVSNSINYKKLNSVSKTLEVPFIGGSRKPLKTGFKKVKFKSVKPNEIMMIGDQLLTDIWGANRMGYYSCLIEPIKREKELIFTKINRSIERRIFRKKSDRFKRGNYYD